MPYMTHTESGQSRIVPDRSRSSYERRGWSVASVADPDPDPEPSTEGRPNVDDVKADWVAYAEDLGIDCDGLTKTEVIDAVLDVEDA